MPALEEEEIYRESFGLYGKRPRPLEYQMGLVPRRVSKPIKKYVKRCMKTMIEKKVQTQANIIGGTPGTAGRVDAIGSYFIVQGLTDSTRTGNFITIDSVQLRGFANIVDAANSGALLRVIVVQDRQTNGAVPAVADILNAASTTSGYDGDNIDRVGGKRFRVLKDVRFAINPGANSSATTTAVAYRVFDWKFKGPFNVHYDATAGAITDIVSGELFVLTISNSATAIVQAEAEKVYHDA